MVEYHKRRVNNGKKEKVKLYFKKIGPFVPMKLVASN